MTTKKAFETLAKKAVKKLAAPPKPGREAPFVMPKKLTIPKSLAAAADLLYNVKNERLRLQHSLEPIQAFENELKQHIIDTLPKSQAGGVAGKVVRVQIKKKDIPVIKDDKAFTTYVRRKGNEDLLVSRPNTKAIEDRWEAGKKIPGVGTFTVVSLSVNKL